MSEMKENKEWFPSWIAVDAAETGRSHRRDGIVCQDKTCVMTRNGVMAAALADGAGSARCSELGAAVVTQQICWLLCERFDAFVQNPSGAEVKQEILLHLFEGLNECAKANECGLQDLASTLLAVAVRGDAYMMLHIGDGAIGYVKEGRIRVASTPDNGEYANETTFVTSPNAFTSLRISKGCDRAIEGFVLMSDGSEASLYSRRNRALAPVLARLVYRLGVTSEEYLRPSVEQSLRETICQKTMDDCSLVLVAKVLRCYRDLSGEELDDYFLLDELELSERDARRQGYRRLLDLLDEPRSVQTLAEHFGNAGEDMDSFREKWISALEELGYIRLVQEDIYARTVGPRGSGIGMTEKEEEHYEKS